MEQKHTLRTGIVIAAAFSLGLVSGYLLWSGSDVAMVPPGTADVVAVEENRPDASAITPPTPLQQLLQEASDLSLAGNHELAIGTLMRADLLALSGEESALVSAQLEQAIADRIAQLSVQGDLAGIDRLYESLTLAMPERAEYYLRLGEHRIEMQNPLGALPVLAQIENHHQLGARARELANQITAAQSGLPIAAIELTRVGNQYLVNASLDGVKEVTLLLDTGASVTTVSPVVLSAMGYSLAGPMVSFSTANGTIQAPLVSIDSVAVAGQAVGPLVVGALVLSRPAGQAVDGLLGMNYLEAFEFNLNQETGVLELLSRRPAP